MKGLRKCLTPFAPDQSGAASALYELGGILVICDAGGCTGNICGFDEPRWFAHKSAIFSAGLRDMDAIMGRDDRLVAKLAQVAEKIDARFAAIIGTPVPAVIGTDYRALAAMAARATGLPVIAVDTNGMELYDVGAQKAFLELFRTFAPRAMTEAEMEAETPARPAGGEAPSCSAGVRKAAGAQGLDLLSSDAGRAAGARTCEREQGCIGVLGATPLDLSCVDAGERIADQLRRAGWTKVVCYGMGASLDDVRTAGRAERNLVVAPAGLAAARYLEQTFGTPYETGYPLVSSIVDGLDFSGKRVLVCHQQVAANALRDRVVAGGGEAMVASWFMLDDALTRPGDVHLVEEDDFTDLVDGGGFDMIIADAAMQRMVPWFAGAFVNARHFAVSGKVVGS